MLEGVYIYFFIFVFVLMDMHAAAGMKIYKRDKGGSLTKGGKE